MVILYYKVNLNINFDWKTKYLLQMGLNLIRNAIGKKADFMWHPTLNLARFQKSAHWFETHCDLHPLLLIFFGQFETQDNITKEQNNFKWRQQLSAVR